MIPKIKVHAVGTVKYVCAECRQLMDPTEAVIVQGRTWHPEHAPKEPDRGR